jgi:hypothetical protein
MVMFTFIIEKFQCVVNLQFEIVNGVNMVAISIFIFIIYLFIQLVVIFIRVQPLHQQEMRERPGQSVSP